MVSVWRAITLIALSCCSCVTVAQPAPAPQPSATPAAASEERYFEQRARWQAGWGTESTLTLSNVEAFSTNEPNDGSTPFDAYWARVFGHVRYGEKFELFADVFSAQGKSEPRVFGLYARAQPSPHVGLRVGRIPLVVGAWQDRAYPSRQPLIGAPLLAQYLLPLRTASFPASVDELLGQSGRAQRARFTRSAADGGGSVALLYEHCWDTGVELFGRLGRVRYRVALTENTPGSPADRGEQANGLTPQARLTWQASEAWRLGASWARGAYLSRATSTLLPAGRRIEDYRQQLVGADARFKQGRVEWNAEWAHNTYDSPNVDGPLRTDGYAADMAFEAWPSITLAARVSALRSSNVLDGRGVSRPWDADATRVEAGVTYRFFSNHAALKAAYQHTRVAAPARRHEDVLALQLALHK
jgi:hypothetical protein